MINQVTNPQWGKHVRDLTEGEGADLVVETIGPDTIEQSIIASATYGHIVMLMTKGANKAGLEISGDVYAKTLATIHRVFVGSRACLEAMNKAIAVHRLRPVIDQVFPFTQAREAYNYFMRGNVFGKVVILGASETKP